MPADPKNRWLTAREVCARFRISKTTLWSWVSAHLIPEPHHLRQRALWREADIAAAEERLITPPRAA
jgi:predicted DNA-binding transcriptional regulator AlpA